MFIKEVSAGIIFQFGLAVAAISTLFFTIVKDVEGKIVLHEVDTIVKDINDDIRLIDIDNSIRRRFVKNFSNTKEDDMLVDKDIINHNQVVQTEAIKLNLIIVGICIFITGLMKWIFKIPLKSILIPSVLGVIVIVCVEMMG